MGQDGHGLVREGSVAGEHRLQLVLVAPLKVRQANGLPPEGEYRFPRGCPQEAAKPLLRRQFQNKRAVPVAEQLLHRNRVRKGNAQPVAQRHFQHALGNAAVAGRPGGQDLPLGRQRLNLGQHPAQGFRPGQSVGVILRLQQHHGMSRPLELRREHAVGAVGGDGEGNQRGGHIQQLEAAAHGVLASHGGGSQNQLSSQRAQKGRQGLAPALRLPAQLFKIFLKGEVDRPAGRARGRQPAHRFHHRQIGPVIRAFFGNEGIEAPGHHRAGGRVPPLQRDFIHHHLGGSQLTRPPEGHEHRARPDGGVEPLGQPATGAAIQVACQRLVAPRKPARHAFCPILGRGGGGGDMLGRAVGA
ncbi:hypothetical protein SDC9_109747 [bioreactor metagenome]|uniref:Uncharacterized protein n=1 Tax=bioreactor metagenome TaxID=1076179 RepID=A0A645BBL7_9ZZZZ